MNLFGRKYRVNPETLRYERVTLNKSQRIQYGIIFGVGMIAFSIFLRNGFERFYETPRQIMYERQNAQLRAEYEAMDNTLHQLEDQLGELQKRDDGLYRSILSLEPVPSTYRAAGTGGSETHTRLKAVRNPGMIRSVSQHMDQLVNKVNIQSSSLENVYSEAVSTQRFLACRPSIHPLSPADPCWMTSSFGYRNDPFTNRRTAHHGIDLAGPYGLDIHATGDGVVCEVHARRYGYGKEVVIDHGFGYKSRYAHLQDILVKKGQKLQRGEVVGTMGSSGRSTGPHLHYEVIKNDHPVNPMYFFFENLNAEEYALLAERVR